MFKKLFSILLTATMILGMVGCGSTEDAAADNDYKVGMVTSVGGVNDGSYSQSASSHNRR